MSNTRSGLLVSPPDQFVSGSVAGLRLLLYFHRPVTTVILVRHAEKNIEPDNPDPDLSPAGRSASAGVGSCSGNAGITAIYATQYRRTQQTVKPLSERWRSRNRDGLRATRRNS